MWPYEENFGVIDSNTLAIAMVFMFAQLEKWLVSSLIIFSSLPKMEVFSLKIEGRKNYHISHFT